MPVHWTRAIFIAGHVGVALADLFDLSDRVSFVAGALGAVTTPVGDAYYFFNPFGEYWLGADYPPEADADVTGRDMRRDIAAAEDLLRSVPGGTWILTYNGFGGRMPAGYELVRVDWNWLASCACGENAGHSPNWFATDDEGPVASAARTGVEARACPRVVRTPSQRLLTERRMGRPKRTQATS